MSSTTDVREWARRKGLDIKGRGRIPDRIKAEYSDDMLASGGTAGDDPGPGSVTEADFPDLPDEAPADALPVGGALPEERPRNPQGQRAGRGLFARRARGSAAAADGKPKRQPRQPKPAEKSRRPVTGFVSGVWGQLASAASPLPPVQKLLYVQGPYAGIVVEEAVKGTRADRLLQPAVRAEEQAKALGGLLCPPMALMWVLVTAPQPALVNGVPVFPPASAQHKAALMGLRMSLLMMAESYAVHLEEIIGQAEASAERERRVDELMAYILSWDLPAEAGEPEMSAEEQAVRRAQDILVPDDNG